MTRHLSWNDRAACLDVDPELFFPIGQSGPAARQAQKAREVCRSCAVRTPCIQLALSTDAQYGVWGGLDPEERKRLGRRLRPVP